MEGRVTFLSADVDYYCTRHGQPTSDMPVFYNPRMRLNRDVSVVVFDALRSRYSLEHMCEPLTGTGIRTLRYFGECSPGFSAVMFDNNPLAVELARQNIERNGFTDRARVVKGDARTLLLSESRARRFDYVDLDPFGTPAPFLNSALLSMEGRHGVLAVTATDMPVLCGVHPRVALRRYGGLSLKSPFSNETALRLLISFVIRAAGANDLSAQPLFVLSADHYIRAWFEVGSSRSHTNRQASEMGLAWYCPRCADSWFTSLMDLCRDHVPERHKSCPGPVSFAGPLWTGMLYDSSLVDAAEQRAFNNSDILKRVAPLMSTIRAECSLSDRPYLDIHQLCDTYGLVPPSLEEIIEFLTGQGYLVSRTHFRSTGIRTDAPVDAVVDTIRSVRNGE
ncbi:MAG: hypothetical protein HXY34_00730 [Candidatus Thorarchaeota archaeon]|nr:hypothetical protein [Candidatus Thorarchaeota archaeon]